MLPGLTADLESVFPGQHQVENDKVGHGIEKGFHSTHAGSRQADAETFEFEFILHRHADSGLVLDEKNGFAQLCTSEAGNVRRNALPLPASLVKVTEPLCASMILFTRASPIP